MRLLKHPSQTRSAIVAASLEEEDGDGDVVPEEGCLEDEAGVEGDFELDDDGPHLSESLLLEHSAH